jgi:hypothetical protein
MGDRPSVQEGSEAMRFTMEDRVPRPHGAWSGIPDDVNQQAIGFALIPFGSSFTTSQGGAWWTENNKV